MTLGTKPLTKKAGKFKAVCKAGAWLPLDSLEHDVRATIEADPKAPTRWDKKLECEVAAVPCALDTTDRGEFERHMAEIHGVKSSATLMNKNRGYAPWPTPSAASKPWRAPKLEDEGKPFKSRDGVTETCPTCGLISELPYLAATELWWREHLERCVGAERGAA